MESELPQKPQPQLPDQAQVRGLLAEAYRLRGRARYLQARHVIALLDLQAALELEPPRANMSDGKAHGGIAWVEDMAWSDQPEHALVAELLTGEQGADGCGAGACGVGFQ